MTPPPIAARELVREQHFNDVWSKELPAVFADVAPYYDRANMIATFGMLKWLERRFMSTVDVNPRERVLDVCAGTNAIGIALLKREPSLDIHAIDRSAEMQSVGQQRARAQGFEIRSTIKDVHELPFPDNHFDVVTLQFASRHLRVGKTFAEIHRVLKPGGRFYHCDMLRPASRAVESLYYAYLRPCLAVTAYLFGSGSAAHGCRRYFIDALQLFYSTDELSGMLSTLGFRDVVGKPVLGGTVAFHRSAKPVAH